MKKTMSIVLSICMLFSMLTGLSLTAQATDYRDEQTQASALVTGDTFEMGMYPQTKVTDDATITALGTIDCTMTNYGYMQSANASEHTSEAVDMTYADVAYNGEVYRKVTINQYRPYYTEGSPSNNNQSKNGYKTGNTYYFKWEPIVWQVLAKESDGVYVMSKTLLDSQAYNNYFESITWETCSLRTWLNEGFYAAAFSEDEQAKIVSITHDNEVSPYISSVSGGEPTTDNLWVLSYSDAINDAYGFSANIATQDEGRKAQGTDYAKSQGLYVSSSSGCSDWWLRTPGTDTNKVCPIYNDGCSGFGINVNKTSVGVRPAFRLNLDSTVGIADAVGCRIGKHSYGDWTSVDADNHKRLCSVCGTEESAAHNWKTEWSKDGTNHWYECADCGAKKDEAVHSYSAWTSVDAMNHKRTCECGAEETAAHRFGTDGEARYTCLDCGKVDDDKKAEAEKADKEAADTAAAGAIIKTIDALTSADQVTTADKDAIEAARKAYDALTAEQKAKVPSDTLKKLEAAETALAAALKAASVTDTIPAQPKAESTTDTIPAGPKADEITLSLNKVKMKKSAKKITIKATLKMNGKAVKGRKVTFKIAGKKYTAKTNAKGVAKVVVKGKKLKAGKKMKYSASFGGKTVTKTVKVKK